MPKGNPLRILPGDRFGLLTVQAVYVEPGGNYGQWVRCRCKCGGYVDRIASQLRAQVRKLEAKGVDGPGCLSCAWKRVGPAVGTV